MQEDNYGVCSLAAQKGDWVLKIKENMTSNHEKNYPHVFNPIDIGSVRLKNRIVFPTWQVNYANTDGTVYNVHMRLDTKSKN